METANRGTNKMWKEKSKSSQQRPSQNGWWEWHEVNIQLFTKQGGYEDRGGGDRRHRGKQGGYRGAKKEKGSKGKRNDDGTRDQSRSVFQSKLLLISCVPTQGQNPSEDLVWTSKVERKWDNLVYGELQFNRLSRPDSVCVTSAPSFSNPDSLYRDIHIEDYGTYFIIAGLWRTRLVTISCTRLFTVHCGRQ